MSKDVTQSQNTVATESEQHATSFDEHMTWQARMFLIRTIPYLYAASLLSGILACYLTKDPRYLFLASPTIFALPTIRYLVPMDKEKKELKMAEIGANKHTIQKLERKLQRTEAELRRQQRSPQNISSAKRAKS